jgi:transposase
MLSEDLRWRIVWMKAAGLSRRSISQMLLVAPNTVDGVWGYFKANHTVQSKRSDSGHHRVLSPANLETIKSLIFEFPTLYLDEMADLLGNIGIVCSTSTLFRVIEELGFSYQKLAKIRFERMSSLAWPICKRSINTLPFNLFSVMKSGLTGLSPFLFLVLFRVRLSMVLTTFLLLSEPYMDSEKQGMV